MCFHIQESAALFSGVKSSPLYPPESVDPAVFRGGLTAPKSAARTGPVNVTGTASDQETWRKRRFGQLGADQTLGDQT